jgi:hypothetical protein
MWRSPFVFGRASMNPTGVVILALWASASVFVVWLALVSTVRKRMASRSQPGAALQLEAPTPQELMEAQSLGLIRPERPDPGREQR